MASRRIHVARVPRHLLAIALVGAFSALSGGTCHWHYCSDHCHCDDPDCDDHRHEARYALAGFVARTSEDPGAHPLAALEACEGVRIPASCLVAPPASSEIERHTARIYEANRSLIGLPPGAGTLVFGGVEIEREVAIVTWLQLFPAEAPAGRPAGRLVFHFDLEGLLLALDNHTWLR